jgi:hypothetical protein
MDPPSNPSLFEKTLPRPAPTLSYSWKEQCPGAQLLYIQDAELANKELSTLAPGAFGFDLEWKPTFVKGAGENPVALVQLANDETILLLQISAMKGNAFDLTHFRNSLSQSVMYRVPGQTGRITRKL